MITPASGRLLGLIAADLPDHTVVMNPAGLTVFVADDGTEIVVGSRVKKRFLGRTEIARFQVVFAAPQRLPAVLKVRQAGAIRRGAVEVQVVEGSADTGGLVASLSSDPVFRSATAGLDFTQFDVELDGENCSATLELMGASFVSIALPPIRSYVRLHADQREALFAAVRALRRVVAS